MSLRHALIVLSAAIGLAQGSLPTFGQSEPKPGRNIVRAQSAAERFDAGKRWAVLIGVNKYLDPAIGKLKFCVADARLMEKTLTEKCGYDRKHVLVIADDQTEDHLQPLRFNLDQQTRDWLKKVGPNDTVIVFFSGHGYLDERGQGFLAPKDCRRNDLGQTGLRTDNLRDMLMQCKATQKVLILDCCHAGGVKGDEDKQDASGEELSASFKRAKGLITLASCSKTQKSQEWDEKGYGLFTYHLARGLFSGDADRDRDGIVSSDELYQYTADEVPPVAQKSLNAEQTPVRIIGEDVFGVFGLARVTRRPDPVMEDREVIASFEVRGEDDGGKATEPLAEASVELLYRADAGSKPRRLASGVSDSRGNVKLTARLTVAEQLRGDFLALVSLGEKSRVWRLDAFPDNLRWNLTVPASGGIITNRQGMKLALIPAGEFPMGSTKADIDRVLAYDPTAKAEYFTDEQPQRSVRITKPFYLGVTEVTVGQFRKFVAADGFKTEAESDGKGGYGFNVATGGSEQDPKYTWKNPGFQQTDEHPVVNVTWNDAVAFCKWLSKQEGHEYRLPTEAEWECACRAGAKTAYSFGDDPEGLARVGNVGDAALKAKIPTWIYTTIKADDGYVFTAPVGRFQANAFGLFDMHGNVWEWCADGYDEKFYATARPDDPFKQPEEGCPRVLRGGSWLNQPRRARSAFRSRDSADYRSNYVGFRLARTP